MFEASLRVIGTPKSLPDNDPEDIRVQFNLWLGIILFSTVSFRHEKEQMLKHKVPNQGSA